MDKSEDLLPDWHKRLLMQDAYRAAERGAPCAVPGLPDEATYQERLMHEAAQQYWLASYSRRLRRMERKRG